MQSDVVFRRGTNVLLRPHEHSEIPLARRGMNDPEVTQYLMRRFPIGEREQEKLFESVSSGKAHDIALAIVTVADNKLIGGIGLHRIDWVHRTAMTGTVIWDKAYWGRGYGTEAKMLLLDVAFNALDLFAIESHVVATNERSLAYGRKCGYEEVGRMPQWVRGQNGERIDEVILMVTQERWRPLWREYMKNCDRSA